MPDLPGVLVCSATRKEAVAKVMALALRLEAERVRKELGAKQSVVVPNQRS